jgi:hypothetical protein
MTWKSGYGHGMEMKGIEVAGRQASVGGGNG